jgi:phosphatidylglycerophosphate synthase
VKFTDTYLFRCANNPYIRFPKPWDTYFTLPLSVPISEYLCKTRLTPNVVSVISLLVACVAAVFFYLGDWVSLVIGALIFHVSYILDCADGYMARKKHMATKFGHWLDHTFDEVKKPILLLALLIGQDALNAGDWWGWAAALLYVFSRVLVKTDSTVKRDFGPARTDLEVTGDSGMLLSPRQKWLFHHFGIVVLFTSIEAQALAFVVGPMFNAPLVGIALAAVLSLVWFIYVDGIRFWTRHFIQA